MEKYYQEVLEVVEAVYVDYQDLGWDRLDYSQEGLIYFYHLVLGRPYLLRRDVPFRIYFEKEFRKHLGRQMKEFV